MSYSNDKSNKNSYIQTNIRIQYMFIEILRLYIFVSIKIPTYKIYQQQQNRRFNPTVRQLNNKKKIIQEHYSHKHTLTSSL